ncbi:MAG: hypothetical protein WCL00_03365 [Bacteroidota bacterium]
MKKGYLILIALLFTLTAFSQKTTEIKIKELPKSTTDWVKTNMPKATIDKAVKLDDKGTVTINILVNSAGRNHILVFDKNGNYLQKGDNLYKAAKADAKGAQRK